MGEQRGEQETGSRDNLGAGIGGQGWEAGTGEQRWKNRVGGAGIETAWTEEQEGVAGMGEKV